MRTRFPSAVALALALGFLAACGNAGPYAARVDGDSISQDQLEDEMRAIAANEAYIRSVESRIQVRGSGAGTFDAAFTGQILGRQIQYVLVDRELDKRDLEVKKADLDAARTVVTQQAGGEEILNGFPQKYRDTLIERAAKVDVLTVSLSGQAATDEAARAYYEGNKDEFTQACVSHILVATRERADQLKGRITGGEDFAAVARTDSLDTQSASQGGDLGCDINTDTFDAPPFTTAMMTQPVGEVGDPVQTQAGFHLLLVRSRTVPPLEEVGARAREKVVTASKAKLQEWINTAVSEAKIEVNPKYGTFDKTTLAVVPPVAPTTTVAPEQPPQSGIQPLRP
ncbi:MAG: peptidylprolyl isomerase [Acidimicrobiia bacterium]